MPTLEDDADLQEVLEEPFYCIIHQIIFYLTYLVGDNAPQTLRTIIETTKFGFTHDYFRQRKLTITEAIEELIAHVDFGERDTEVEKYFFDGILTEIPFKNVTIIGSDYFCVDQLSTLITVSRLSLEE